MVDIKLGFGDCLEIMKHIPDNSIDMILCDLPYGTTACSWDIIINFESLWKQYKRILKKKCGIVLFGNQPFTSLLITSNIKWFKYCWEWDKVRPSGFQIAKYKPMSRHEDICIFGESSINYYPIMELRDKIIKGTVGKSSDSSPLLYNDGLERSYTHKYPQSIIIYCKENGLHPTQKPVPLLEYLIKTYSNENDTVLDNCMGSGSTGIACINTNRNFIGIEKDRHYFNIASERIYKHKTYMDDLEKRSNEPIPEFKF